MSNKRIIALSEKVTLDSGDFFAIDNPSGGTKKHQAKKILDPIAKNAEDIADLKEAISPAFTYGKQYIDSGTAQEGYYWASGSSVNRAVVAGNAYRTFDSFDIKAGTYYVNYAPNSFSFAKYSNNTVVTILSISNKLTNTLYRVNVPYDATIYYTIDSRLISPANIMFTSADMPNTYEAGIFKSIYQFSNLFKTSQKVRVVGMGQEYETIQGACDAATAGDTILVMPGMYYEQVSIWGKKLNIIGVDKQQCLLLSDLGNYDYPPLEMNIGTLANMTIMETGANADSSLDDSKYCTAYCLHIESGVNADGEEFLIDNCNFISNIHACIGCGLYQNLTVHFRNCSFHSTDEKSRGVERGTFYYHNNTGTATGQKIIVENCLIHAAKDYCVWAGLTGGSGGEMISTFVGNTLYSDTLYNNDTTINGTFNTTTFQLSPVSSGNNVNKLNNGIQTRDTVTYRRYLTSSDDALAQNPGVYGISAAANSKPSNLPTGYPSTQTGFLVVMSTLNNSVQLAFVSAQYSGKLWAYLGYSWVDLTA